MLAALRSLRVGGNRAAAVAAALPQSHKAPRGAAAAESPRRGGASAGAARANPVPGGNAAAALAHLCSLLPPAAPLLNPAVIAKMSARGDGLAVVPKAEGGYGKYSNGKAVQIPAYYSGFVFYLKLADDANVARFFTATAAASGKSFEEIREELVTRVYYQDADGVETVHLMRCGTSPAGMKYGSSNVYITPGLVDGDFVLGTRPTPVLPPAEYERRLRKTEEINRPLYELMMCASFRACRPGTMLHSQLTGTCPLYGEHVHGFPVDFDPLQPVGLGADAKVEQWGCQEERVAIWAPPPRVAAGCRVQALESSERLDYVTRTRYILFYNKDTGEWECEEEEIYAIFTLDCATKPEPLQPGFTAVRGSFQSSHPIKGRTTVLDSERVTLNGCFQAAVSGSRVVRRNLPSLGAALATAAAAISAERTAEHLAERRAVVHAALTGLQAGDVSLQRRHAAALRARASAEHDRDADAVLRGAEVEAAQRALQELVAAKEEAWQSHLDLMHSLDTVVAQTHADLQASRALQGKVAADLADVPGFVDDIASGQPITLPDFY